MTSGITMEELQLAARNHGMPLEALRYDITPVGLHYLLIHFDIPQVDERDWRLELGGRVRAPLALTMEELRRRPAATLPVTLECAGAAPPWSAPAGCGPCRRPPAARRPRRPAGCRSGSAGSAGRPG